MERESKSGTKAGADKDKQKMGILAGTVRVNLHLLFKFDTKEHNRKTCCV